jgi:hypothetical protein
MNGKYNKMPKEIMQRNVHVCSYNCLGLKIPNTIELNLCCDMTDFIKEFLRLVSLNNMCVFSNNILNLIKINYNNTNIIYHDTQIKDFDICEHRFRIDFPKLIGIKVLSVIYIYNYKEKLKLVIKEIKKLSGTQIKINCNSYDDALLDHYFLLGITEINADGSIKNTRPCLIDSF